jgi:hypothetical protein
VLIFPSVHLPVDIYQLFQPISQVVLRVICLCHGKQILERGISPLAMLSLLLIDDSVHIFFHFREGPELPLIKQRLGFYLLNVGHELIDIKVIQPLKLPPSILNQCIQSGISSALAIENIHQLFFQSF